MFIGVIVNMPRPMPSLVSDSVFQVILMKGKIASNPVPLRLRTCVRQLISFEEDLLAFSHAAASNTREEGAPYRRCPS